MIRRRSAGIIAWIVGDVGMLAGVLVVVVVVVVRVGWRCVLAGRIGGRWGVRSSCWCSAGAALYHRWVHGEIFVLGVRRMNEIVCVRVYVCVGVWHDTRIIFFFSNLAICERKAKWLFTFHDESELVADKNLLHNNPDCAVLRVCVCECVFLLAIYILKWMRNLLDVHHNWQQHIKSRITFFTFKTKFR